MTRYHKKRLAFLLVLALVINAVPVYAHISSGRGATFISVDDDTVTGAGASSGSSVDTESASPSLSPTPKVFSYEDDLEVGKGDYGYVSLSDGMKADYDKLYKACVSFVKDKKDATNYMTGAGGTTRYYESDMAVELSDINESEDTSAPAGYRQGQVWQLWNSFKYDNPQFYWLESDPITLQASEKGDEESTTYSTSVTKIVPVVADEYRYAKDREKTDDLISSRIDDIKKIREDVVKEDEEDTSYKQVSWQEEIVRRIHDEIIDRVNFKEKDSVPIEDIKSTSIVGFFDRSGIISVGYAKTFAFLLQTCGIKQVYMTGATIRDTGESVYAWNAVSVDNGSSYTYYDVSWDDRGRNSPGYDYIYYAMNAQTFAKTHTANPYTKAGGYLWLYRTPSISTGDNTYYTKYEANAMLSGTDESIFKNRLKKAIETAPRQYAFLLCTKEQYDKFYYELPEFVNTRFRIVKDMGYDIPVYLFTINKSLYDDKGNYISGSQSAVSNPADTSIPSPPPSATPTISKTPVLPPGESGMPRASSYPGASQPVPSAAPSGNIPSAPVLSSGSPIPTGSILPSAASLPPGATISAAPSSSPDIYYNAPVIKDGVSTWQTVYFGHYWQTDSNHDGKTDEYDTREPIRWRVLENDSYILTLVSDKVLDVRSYHTQRETVAWTTSDICKWLGTEFAAKAFTQTEQGLLRYSAIYDGVDMSYSKVGLMGYDEVINTGYGFSSELTTDRGRTATCSDYAWFKGLYEGGSGGSKRDCGWWLCTRGVVDYYSAFVNSNGSVSKEGAAVNFSYLGVRPMIKVLLSDKDLVYAGTIDSLGRTTTGDKTPADLPGDVYATANPTVSPTPYMTSPAVHDVSPSPVVSVSPAATYTPPAIYSWIPVSTPTIKPAATPTSTVDSAVKKPSVVKGFVVKKTKKKKNIYIKWNKTSGAKAYFLKCTSDKKMKKTVRIKYTTRNKIRWKLPKKKTYYFRVRAYKWNKKQTKRIYGKWSKKIKKRT